MFLGVARWHPSGHTKASSDPWFRTSVTVLQHRRLGYHKGSESVMNSYDSWIYPVWELEIGWDSLRKVEMIRWDYTILYVEIGVRARCSDHQTVAGCGDGSFQGHV
jgi:hypothetical protein